MKPLIQAVACFSEGRRTEIVQQIVDSMTRAGGIHLLGTEARAQENRCQVTLVGLPSEVEKALFAGVRAAAEHINLTQHSGAHPRFGAMDMISVIPIRDVEIEESIGLAQKLGQKVARELKIPVYMIEAAALRSVYEDTTTLYQTAFQYEQLAEHIGTDPFWMPDFGPAQVGTAGAIFIGAYLPRVYGHLTCSTDAAARLEKLAEAASSLRDVRCQVTDHGLSFTLTNYRRTPLYRVLELLRREAAHAGLTIERCGLDGFVPQAALLESAGWYMQLADFKPEQLLEQRISEAEGRPTPLALEEPPVPEDATQHVFLPTISDAQRLESFASAVGQSTITPGGGAVSALAGALAAALAEMVSGLTISKRGYEEVEQNMRAIRTAATAVRAKLLASVDQDVEAFQHLMDALRLPKADTERPAAIQAATLTATQVPLEVARNGYAALQLVAQVAELGNHNAAIDAAVGAYIGLAAVESAALNVRINVLGLEDTETAERYTAEVTRLIETARQLAQQVIAVASRRGGLTEDK